MEDKAALKIAVRVLTEKRRQYAPEARVYEMTDDPALLNYHKHWEEIDQAITRINFMIETRTFHPIAGSIQLKTGT